MSINLNKIKLYRFLTENLFKLLDTAPKDILADKECSKIWMSSFFKAVNMCRLSLSEQEINYIKSALNKEDLITKTTEEEIILIKKQLIAEVLYDINIKILDRKMLEIKQLLGSDYNKYESGIKKIIVDLI